MSGTNVPSGAQSVASVFALIQFIWIAVSGGLDDAFESELMGHVQLFGTICVAAAAAWFAYGRGVKDAQQPTSETTS